MADINQCGSRKLCSLVGIKTELGARIVRYRKLRQRINNFDELISVAGITSGILERIRNKCTIKKRRGPMPQKKKGRATKVRSRARQNSSASKQKHEKTASAIPDLNISSNLLRNKSVVGDNQVKHFSPVCIHSSPSGQLLTTVYRCVPEKISQNKRGLVRTVTENVSTKALPPSCYAGPSNRSNAKPAANAKRVSHRPNTSTDVNSQVRRALRQWLDDVDALSPPKGKRWSNRSSSQNEFSYKKSHSPKRKKPSSKRKSPSPKRKSPSPERPWNLKHTTPPPGKRSTDLRRELSKEESICLWLNDVEASSSPNMIQLFSRTPSPNKSSLKKSPSPKRTATPIRISSQRRARNGSPSTASSESDSRHSKKRRRRNLKQRARERDLDSPSLEMEKLLRRSRPREVSVSFDHDGRSRYSRSPKVQRQLSASVSRTSELKITSTDIIDKALDRIGNMNVVNNVSTSSVDRSPSPRMHPGYENRTRGESYQGRDRRVREQPNVNKSPTDAFAYTETVVNNAPNSSANVSPSPRMDDLRNRDRGESYQGRGRSRTREQSTVNNSPINAVDDAMNVINNVPNSSANVSPVPRIDYLRKHVRGESYPGDRMIQEQPTMSYTQTYGANYAMKVVNTAPENLSPSPPGSPVDISPTGVVYNVPVASEDQSPSPQRDTTSGKQALDESNQGKDKTSQEQPSGSRQDRRSKKLSKTGVDKSASSSSADQRKRTRSKGRRDRRNRERPEDDVNTSDVSKASSSSESPKSRKHKHSRDEEEPRRHDRHRRHRNPRDHRHRYKYPREEEEETSFSCRIL